MKYVKGNYLVLCEELGNFLKTGFSLGVITNRSKPLYVIFFSTRVVNNSKMTKNEEQNNLFRLNYNNYTWFLTSRPMQHLLQQVNRFCFQPLSFGLKTNKLTGHFLKFYICKIRTTPTFTYVLYCIPMCLILSTHSTYLHFLYFTTQTPEFY